MKPDKNVPIPEEVQRRGKYKRMAELMQKPGDSYLLPEDEYKSLCSAMSKLGYSYVKADQGKGMVRVWRQR